MHYSSFLVPLVLHKIPKVTPSAWVLNEQGGGKFANFDQNRRLSLKRYQKGPS